MIPMKTNNHDNMAGESSAYRAAAENVEKERFAEADLNESTVIEVPLPAEKIREFEAYGRLLKKILERPLRSAR